MADADKLAVYNDVLTELGDAELASLSETSERLARLDAAYLTAVKFVLKQGQWNFATRRAQISFVADSAGFPPYQFRGSLPSDYLEKTWVKESALDPMEIQYAITGTAIYSYDSVGLMQYISQDADDVIDPSNWPPLFRQTVVYYLAHQIAVKLTHITAELKGQIRSLYMSSLSEAKSIEAVTYADQDIPKNRMRVMRRAMEFLGQSLVGQIPVYDQVNQLTWSMQQSWDDVLNHCLESGAWNFATRRATLTGGTEDIPGNTLDNIIEGYTVPPATEEEETNLPDAAAFDYGYVLPSDFLHKIWVKADANNEFETPHQFLNYRLYTNVVPVVMEYISNDSEAIDPDNWPQHFTDAFASQLALSATPSLVVTEGKRSTRIDANGLRRDLEAIYSRNLALARTKDSLQQYPKTLAAGSFVRARRGGAWGSSRRLR